MYSTSGAALDPARASAQGEPADRALFDPQRAPVLRAAALRPASMRDHLSARPTWLSHSPTTFRTRLTPSSLRSSTIGPCGKSATTPSTRRHNGRRREEQKRYDAEYRKARLAAMVRQETRDIRSADDERAADKQNQEIASVRHEAAQAWSDHLVVEQRFAVCRDAPTRAEPLGISGVPARWPRRSAHGGSRTPANIARSHGPCEPQRDP